MKAVSMRFLKPWVFLPMNLVYVNSSFPGPQILCINKNKYKQMFMYPSPPYFLAIRITAKFSLTPPSLQLSIWQNCIAPVLRNCLKMTRFWHCSPVATPIPSGFNACLEEASNSALITYCIKIFRYSDSNNIHWNHACRVFSVPTHSHLEIIHRPYKWGNNR